MTAVTAPSLPASATALAPTPAGQQSRLPAPASAAAPPLEAYATRPVPRYTSYPTAPHFSDAVGARDYAGWLAALDPAAAISLYLHVPFCRQLCWYCGCNMKLAKRDSPIAAYAATLLHEVDLVAQHMPGRLRVSHLHWGGGTPTALVPDDLARSMDQVWSRFDRDPGAEIAIESDPRTLTREMIARIGRLGFTRASFGVQEFDPTVQRTINRVQPPEMVRASVEGLREAGVSAVNFDLIYGLPHQTVASLVETVRLCVEMRPDRLALFGYAHVPWMAKRQRLIDEATLPGPAARLAQAEAAARALAEAGYVAIGLDHFARPDDPLARAAAAGTLRRNFQGYTTDDAAALIGLGATSIGRTPFGFVQNLAETGAWARAVEGGVLPVGRGIAFAGQDRLRGAVIEALMCSGRVDLAAEGRAHAVGPDWWHEHCAALDGLAADGLLVRRGARLALTETGRPLVRVVASEFDAYLARSAGRHALAV
ncbi:MAG: oxygen-independent coproporphyrinogen III oxidase [Pseudomonadota bacterium]